MIDLDFLDKAEGRHVDRANAQAILAGLAKFEEIADLPVYAMSPPHRLVPYLAQLSHESAGMVYDEEIASGKAYEGRADLGNTQPGDGVRFKGRTGIQLTGRRNYRAFTLWCRERWPDAPDFETNPGLVNTTPWEGLAPIWFWNVGNQTGRSLNLFADEGNFEAITRKINGGLNGYEDRCARYTRYALTYLGLPADKNGIKDFQVRAGFTGRDVDGIAGQKTRNALHAALKADQPQEAASPPSVATYAAGAYRATIQPDGTLTVETV